MELTFLGTGTSTGVPQIGCKCKTCTSSDPRDKRMRASVLIDYKDKSLLIDVGPDFYHQCLRENSPKIDALLITHYHYDHIGGLVDLRPYSVKAPNHHFPVYCRQDVEDVLHASVPYCFVPNPAPGVPTFSITRISPYHPFHFGEIEIMPLEIYHYKLPILGYRIGQLAYITDAKTIPDETIQKITNIDTIVINALRIEDHFSHMTLAEALAIIKKVKPRIAYLTHLSHDMGLHKEVEATLPSNVRIAYDGLRIQIPN